MYLQHLVVLHMSIVKLVKMFFSSDCVLSMCTLYFSVAAVCGAVSATVVVP